jgi:hypothetical protein
MMQHLTAREIAGLKEEYSIRDIDNPNEVLILFEAEDLQEAREFFDSCCVATIGKSNSNASKKVLGTRVDRAEVHLAMKL